MDEQRREYCDLVMKGGVTSGLVYPNAVLALAEDYRFKNIGGTSAGAIAAVACAAAALGERRKDRAPLGLPVDQSMVGFAGLKKVAADLKTPGFIYALFQPSRGVRAVYAMVVRLAGGGGIIAKLGALAFGIGAIAGIEFCLILAVFLGNGFWLAHLRGMIAVVFPAVPCALAVATAIGLSRTARVVRRNFLGLCTGLGEKRWFHRNRPALTEWLHEIVQNLAGREATHDPVLFEDLWNAPTYPGEPGGDTVLALRMITTSVSHHEPRSLPLDDGRFWFRKEDFERLFPAALVKWLIAEDRAPIFRDGKTYYELPRNGRLPILVGARMSLSFPLLISAIPLYEPDFKAAGPSVPRKAIALPAVVAGPKTGSRLDSTEGLASGGAGENFEPGSTDPPPFRICWFSDGGISSNFPLHLFDAPLPRWPTFAINLVYAEGDDLEQDDDVSLPTEDEKDWQRNYVSIAKKCAGREVAAFLFGIVGTMQNWRDLLLARAPGQRDRIVRVQLAKNEGGMNLNMDRTTLAAISSKGTRAGNVLRSEFKFDNHRWIRWRNVAATTEMFFNQFARGAAPTPHCKEADASGTLGARQPPRYPFNAEQQSEAQRRFEVMVGHGEHWGASRNPSLLAGAPPPQPRLVITPIY